jgi:hypothetical protein
MTNRHLARTLDAIANQMQVVIGVTTERRRSIGADAQKPVDLEAPWTAWLQRVPPQNRRTCHGTVYRRQVRFCTRCDRRLDTIAARKRRAKPQAMRSRFANKDPGESNSRWVAVPNASVRTVKRRRTRRASSRPAPATFVNGGPITAHVGRVTFEDATADRINHDTTNRRGRRRSATGPTDVRSNRIQSASGPLPGTVVLKTTAIDHESMQLSGVLTPRKIPRPA